MSYLQIKQSSIARQARKGMSIVTISRKPKQSVVSRALMRLKEEITPDRRLWRAISSLAACIVALLGGCLDGGPVHVQPFASEEYIWVSSISPNAGSPRVFRKTFSLASSPAHATLYLFGPYNADVLVNGANVIHIAQGGPILTNERPLEITDISNVLIAGSNTIQVTASASDVLALKILPSEQGIDAKPLVVSDASWHGSTDGSNWIPVTSFGSIESDFTRFKGNFDLNLYQWPGYQGINAILDHLLLEPVSTTDSGFSSITLDFGKEVSGRLRVDSSSSAPMHLQMSFGETLQEATPDLATVGPKSLLVPASAMAYGPVTAFRYVQVVFLDGPSSGQSLRIRMDQVFRNLPLAKQFQDPDPLLVQIWQTGVYTAQLGMQVGFWDAPKRDRNTFAADLYVSARTARATFGNATDPLVKATLEDLARRTCIVKGLPTTGKDINCIPSFNAWWILDLGDLYRSSGDVVYLATQRGNLTAILARMQSQLARGLFADDSSTFQFVDWSPGMFHFAGQTAAEASKVTSMIYYMAFQEAAFLFGRMGDSQSEASYAAIAAAIKSAAVAAYLDSGTGTFGPRMQTNAMAVYSGIADPSLYSAIFTRILSQPPSQEITPYFYYFVLEAMETTGHRPEALNLIRQVWGGMLAAGATSFWEIDPPGCANSVNVGLCMINDFDNLSIQGSHLIMSMAHGWASGPAVFLMKHQR
jgi:alpha-L-rhamnosidase